MIKLNERNDYEKGGKIIREQNKMDMYCMHCKVQFCLGCWNTVTPISQRKCNRPMNMY